jgi:RHS repeat-associated protein
MNKSGNRKQNEFDYSSIPNGIEENSHVRLSEQENACGRQGRQAMQSDLRFLPCCASVGMTIQSVVVSGRSGRGGGSCFFYFVNTCAAASATSFCFFRSAQSFRPKGGISNNFTLTNRGFTGHEHYPYLKIINMNGRLYDPVIGRFFSPDQYVANSSFTQDFNRYSYARNNPLHYIDPSGQFIWNSIGNFFFFPARVLAEATTWVNDKINGTGRPNGYFNESYLFGQTEPGARTTIAPCTQLSYGQPGYISQRAEYRPIGFGTDWGRSFLGADNEFHNLVKDWEEKPYERKEGSHKLMWLSKKAAASAGIHFKALGKVILGTYAGEFEGENIYESIAVGKGIYSGGLTLPGRGIIIGEGTFALREKSRQVKALMQHEFGHILQSRLVGLKAFYQVIAPESFASASLDLATNHKWDHDTYWTETWANYMSHQYFGDQSLLNSGSYPVKNISTFNLMRLFAASPFFFP